MDLAYDAMNRLVSVSGPDIEARFTYEYRNRVTSRTFNGETTFLIYDDWNLIAEYDASGKLKARYVHGPRIDEVILTVNDHGTFFHHHDALGSVTHLTDVDGVVVESYQYDVYGNVTMFDGEEAFLENSAIDNRFLFTGREYLAGLDLYDYRNRVYSADLGRFVQTDPIRFDAGDVNIYRYVFNRILFGTDPYGLLMAQITVFVDLSTPTGHTWTEITYSDGYTYNRGNYASGLRDDSGRQYQLSQTWDITDESAAAAHAYIEAQNGLYSFTQNNCVDASHGALNAAQINTPSTFSYFGMSPSVPALFGYWLDPGFFDEE